MRRLVRAVAGGRRPSSEDQSEGRTRRREPLKQHAGQNQSNGHGKDDQERHGAVRNDGRDKVKVGRCARSDGDQLKQRACGTEQEDARHHRDDRRKADGGKGEAQAIDDRCDDQAG